MASGLTDLGELIQLVRDPLSRAYALEAVSAHYGGAQRAAIVSLWIAVLYDIISKLRELALRGDQAAASVVAKVEQAASTQNVQQSLAIERDLLRNAFETFALFDGHEYEDLQRLERDRHRCAHPALLATGQLFEPTPESVRAHIVHAVHHLLRLEPVHGKYVLDRIIADITSPTFPSDLDQACLFLNSRYLDRCKEVLVRNLVVALVKTILADAGAVGVDANSPRSALVLALRATSRRWPIVYERTMRDLLPALVRDLHDDRIPALYDLIAADVRVWRWIDQATRIRLREHLVRLAQGTFSGGAALGHIETFVDVEEMWPTLIAIMERERVDDWVPQDSATRADPIAAAVGLYRDARSYRGAEHIGASAILPLAPYMSDDDVTAVLNAVRENSEIWDASGSPSIMVHFLEATRSQMPRTRGAWKDLLDFISNIDRDEHWLPVRRRLATMDAGQGQVDT